MKALAQKPDDIPEDVWAHTYEVMYLARDDEHLRLNIARAILAERKRNSALLQQLYDLLHNDTPYGGAACFLPAGGNEAERLVDEANDLLRAAGVKRYGSHAA